MKRFVIFAVVYPLLVLLGVLLAIKEARSADLTFMSWMVGAAYLIGIIPALVSAAVDWGFSAEPFYIRIPLVMVAAVGTAMAAITAVKFGELLHLWTPILMISLISGIPAAVCSLLSDKSMRSSNA